MDIGTNTLLALVGRVRADGTIETLADLATITRLGEGVDRTRYLSTAAMHRTLDALREFTARARALGARKIAAVATSAVRDARNRETFLDAVRDITGGDVEVISGEREARLAFAGASVGTGLVPGTVVLVFDVGGGSTELIAGPVGGVPEFVRSVDVGSVRLTERFIHHDPPWPSELQQVTDVVRRSLELLPVPAHQVLIGLAGTVTTLAAMSADPPRFEGASVHGHWLSREAVERMIARLAALPLSTRRTLAGLDPRRADVIIAGAAIVRAVMEWAGQSRILVSHGGVRVGLLLERSRQP